MKLHKETKKQSDEIRHGKWYGDACGAAFAMELIGERWTLLIIRELMLGPRRFSDIRAELPGLSAKVLTERLEGLEATGILTRRTLPPPSASRVYELTPWGLELEPVTQALGRWSVRSPLHDPTLLLTPTSFLLSLRTMIDPQRAGDLCVTALFRTARETLVAKLAAGTLTVERAPAQSPDAELVFSAPSVSNFLGVLYGKRDPAECDVTIEGDPALAERFIGAFALPPKCPPPLSGL